jgi:hypothetical protein
MGVEAGEEEESSRPPVTRSIEPEPRPTPGEIRERTAQFLAGALIGLLAGTIIATFVYAFLRTHQGAVDLAQIIIPSLTTLVGSVIGYYFGSERRGSN